MKIRVEITNCEFGVKSGYKYKCSEVGKIDAKASLLEKYFRVDSVPKYLNPSIEIVKEYDNVPDKNKEWLLARLNEELNDSIFCYCKLHVEDLDQLVSRFNKEFSKGELNVCYKLHFNECTEDNNEYKKPDFSKTCQASHKLFHLKQRIKNKLQEHKTNKSNFTCVLSK